MKRIGRTALLIIAATSVATSGLAYLAANTVDESHAGSTTLPFSAAPVKCDRPGSLVFPNGNGNGNNSQGSSQGSVKCTATSAGQMVVNATLVTGSAGTCTTIRFDGSGLSGPVNVPLASALQAKGAIVSPLAAGKKFDGSAQLTGCNGPGTISITFTLSVVPI